MTKGMILSFFILVSAFSERNKNNGTTGECSESSLMYKKLIPFIFKSFLQWSVICSVLFSWPLTYSLRASMAYSIGTECDKFCLNIICIRCFTSVPDPWGFYTNPDHGSVPVDCGSGSWSFHQGLPRCKKSFFLPTTYFNPLREHVIKKSWYGSGYKTLRIRIREARKTFGFYESRSGSGTQCFT